MREEIRLALTWLGFWLRLPGYRSPAALAAVAEAAAAAARHSNDFAVGGGRLSVSSNSGHRSVSRGRSSSLQGARPSIEMVASLRFNDDLANACK